MLYARDVVVVRLESQTWLVCYTAVFADGSELEQRREFPSYGERAARKYARTLRGYLSIMPERLTPFGN